MAKRFFYISLGVLALTISYHLGAVGTAGANAEGEIVAGIASVGDVAVVITESGDVYCGETSGDMYPLCHPTGLGLPLSYLGNVFSGAVATEKSSWGDIKREFK